MTDAPRSSATGQDGSASGDIGARLRAQRNSRKMDLHTAAHELHVDSWILEALENDDFACMGAPIYVKGHLRNYAKLLDLPEQEILAQFEELEHPRDPEIGSQRPWGQAIERKLPAGWLSSVIWLLAGVPILLAGGWLYQQIDKQERAEESAATTVAVPAVRPQPETQPGVTEPARGTVRDETTNGEDTFREPGADPAVGDERETLQQAGTAVGSRTEDTTGDANPEMATALVIAPGETDDLETTTVELQFNGESWVEIYDGAGRRIYFDLVATGRRLQVAGTAPLDIFLGNAPVVEIRTGGESIDFSRRVRNDNTARIIIPAATE